MPMQKVASSSITAGLVSIQQRGAARAAYRNESTDKSIYPGFLTGLSVQYKTKSDVWSFGIGADYMSTKSEVNNYDARRGGGIEALKLIRKYQGCCCRNFYPV